MSSRDVKILLVGIDLSDLGRIRRSLSANKQNKFFEAYNLKDAMVFIKENRVDLIIFDLDDLSEDKIQSILSMRDIDDKTPIVLLGNKINDMALEILKAFPNILVLEKPRGIGALESVASKFLRGETVYNRKYRRFNTKETAQIILFSNGKEYDCHIVNLSKGGAFLEIKNFTEKVEGLIKIKLNLNQIQKDYTLSAKIVWNLVTQNSCQIGIQFIKSNDIYSQFLKNF